MPNRILYEDINESRGLGELPSFAQDLFKRLITYADDYGRFNGDIQIMRARLFPRELDGVSESDVEDGVIDLAGAGKIRLYTAAAGSRQAGDTIVYGYFPNWHARQRQRDTRKKHPDPASEAVNDWAVRRFVPTALKVQIFQRDNFTCQECRRDFILAGVPAQRAMRLLSGALHVDHIVPVTQGGRATAENLRLLCAGCNLSRPKRASLEELRQLAASCGQPPQPAADGGLARMGAESESESESESQQPPTSVVVVGAPQADAPTTPKAGESSSKRSRKQPTTPPPESLEPNDADYAAGAEVGLSRDQVHSKASAMLDFFRARGEARADWHATLRTWLRNAPKFDQPPRASPPSRASPAVPAAAVSTLPARNVRTY